MTLANAGTYYWQATYSGDANNATSTSTCGPAGEIETVTSATPPPSIKPTHLRTSLLGSGRFGGGWCHWFGDVIFVFSGASVTDSATLSGTEPRAAGGTVTYTVYSGHDWAHPHVVASGGR